MKRRQFLAAAVLGPLWVQMAGMSRAAGAAPVLKLATQVSGTVNWELQTIIRHGFDQQSGFSLEVIDTADAAAAQVAFHGGEADAIVSDFLWVARQRAAGKDYVFIPYSRAVGALMVPGNSAVTTLAGLKGQKIGIAGGPVDKSWLILQAYARKAENFDLKGETEQVFGAPPLIFQQALSGELAGAVNFWHFGAKMAAAGMRPLVTVSQAAEALGLDPQTPLLGYVVKGELMKGNPAAVRGLAAASRAAKALLASDDATWITLRPLMNAKTDEQFEALKTGFREGIPAAGAVDLEAAAGLLELMASLGGKDLMGDVTTLPDGVFLSPEP